MREPEQGQKMNVFNPEALKQGDCVQLVSELEELGDDAPKYMVETVGGSHGNKVFCKQIGRELYAQCFKKVVN